MLWVVSWDMGSRGPKCDTGENGAMRGAVASLQGKKSQRWLIVLLAWVFRRAGPPLVAMGGLCAVDNPHSSCMP